MNSFPEDFSYFHSNKKLYESNIQICQEKITQCRKHIYDLYNKAIENQDSGLILDLSDYDPIIKKTLLLELFTRFPKIYCILSQNGDYYHVLRVHKYTLNKIAHFNHFCLVISDYFYTF